MKRKSISKKIREDVYNKYNGHCAYCGKKIDYKEMQVDHLLPFDFYGKDCFENYVPSCRRCNNYKGNSLIEDFREDIIEIPRKLKQYQTIYNVGLDFKFIKEQEKPNIIFYFEKFDGKITSEKYCSLQLKGTELEQEIINRVNQYIHNWCCTRTEEEKKKIFEAQLKIEKDNVKCMTAQLKTNGEYIKYAKG